MQFPISTKRGNSNPTWNTAFSQHCTVVDVISSTQRQLKYTWIRTEDIDLVCFLLESCLPRTGVFFKAGENDLWNGYSNEMTIVIVFQKWAVPRDAGRRLYGDLSRKVIIGRKLEISNTGFESSHPYSIQKPDGLMMIVVAPYAPEIFFSDKQIAQEIYNLCDVYTLGAERRWIGPNDPTEDRIAPFRPDRRVKEKKDEAFSAEQIMSPEISPIQSPHKAFLGVWDEMLESQNHVQQVTLLGDSHARRLPAINIDSPPPIIVDQSSEMLVL